MCVSISHMSRFRIPLLGRSCCQHLNGWLRNYSPPTLPDVRASSVDRWVRRDISTTTQTGRKTKTKSNVLGATVPVTRIIDAESSKTNIQPPLTLQQRLAANTDLPKLLTVIVTDLETTGFNRSKDRIIEIAAQDLAGGMNSTFQTLVNPGIEIMNDSIHGISTDMACRPDVPRMEELIPIFLKYVESRQNPGGYVMLVAHNGKAFDFQFFVKEFERCSYKIPQNWLLLDSLPLGRECMKAVEGKVKPKSSMQALKEYYNLTRDGEAHRALSDVLLLSQVFQKLTIDLNLSLSDLVLRSYTAPDIIAGMAAANAAKYKKT